MQELIQQSSTASSLQDRLEQFEQEQRRLGDVIADSTVAFVVFLEMKGDHESGDRLLIGVSAKLAREVGMGSSVEDGNYSFQATDDFRRVRVISPCGTTSFHLMVNGSPVSHDNFLMRAFSKPQAAIDWFENRFGEVITSRHYDYGVPQIIRFCY